MLTSVGHIDGEETVSHHGGIQDMMHKYITRSRLKLTSVGHIDDQGTVSQHGGIQDMMHKYY